ncbi:MAG: hypothetical protein IKM31_07720 [Oscillospiraceae bacterium]|nr:hypothetical protein [Oscillospiraceae bacterium]
MLHIIQIILQDFIHEFSGHFGEVSGLTFTQSFQNDEGAFGRFAREDKVACPIDTENTWDMFFHADHSFRRGNVTAAGNSQREKKKARSVKWLRTLSENAVFCSAPTLIVGRRQNQIKEQDPERISLRTLLENTAFRSAPTLIAGRRQNQIKKQDPERVSLRTLSGGAEDGT